MNVARILYPVEVLGPGKRIGIWMCGCSRGCRGCSNPELWEQRPEYEVSVRDVVKLVQRIADNHDVDGFTISGGEPMDQAQELAVLVKELTEYSEDILVYTGYRFEQLRERDDDATDSVLNTISVLIDGEYIEEENTDVLLRGSKNQTIHVLNPELEGRYREYLKLTHNQIQNFTTSDGVVSVGIHHKGFGG